MKLLDAKKGYFIFDRFSFCVVAIAIDCPITVSRIYRSKLNFGPGRKLNLKTREESIDMKCKHRNISGIDCGEEGHKWIGNDEMLTTNVIYHYTPLYCTWQSMGNWSSAKLSLFPFCALNIISFMSLMLYPYHHSHQYNLYSALIKSNLYLHMYYNIFIFMSIHLQQWPYVICSHCSSPPQDCSTCLHLAIIINHWRRWLPAMPGTHLMR